MPVYTIGVQKRCMVIDMTKTFEAIFGEIEALPIIDTHEHLCEESEISDPDLLRMYLIHYFKVDLLTAGLSLEKMKIATDSTVPVLERWAILEPYWEVSRLTGYGQSLDLAVKKLYGADRIDRNSIVQLSDTFRKANCPGHYREVLREHCHIETSINDVPSGKRAADSLFHFAARIDPMVCPKNREDLMALGERTGVRVHSLADFEEACARYLEQLLDNGVVALKCGLAYDRSLYFERVSRSEAEDIFVKMMAQEDSAGLPLLRMQDYLMHHLLAMADRKELVLQIHTGILEGLRYTLNNSDPVLLNNLFMEYRHIKFDLFHIGYPYHHSVAALAKMFPNVYIDMAWAHIISPPACQAMLSEWLETIPVTKIMGFGGDYCFVDGVYGHQYLARKNIAAALAEKVDQKLISKKQAVVLAQRLLYGNPKTLFGV